MAQQPQNHDDDHQRQQQREHEQQERDRQRQEQQSQPKPPSAADKAAADKARAAQREVQAFGSIGAQIILDYNGDGGLGARGGAAATIEENTAVRDSHYVALGLDPVAPSGPPPSLEVRKARAAAAEAQAKANEQIQAAHAAPGAGAASRVSSLAAGLITEPADVPVAPPDSMSGGQQAVHK